MAPFRMTALRAAAASALLLGGAWVAWRTTLGRPTPPPRPAPPGAIGQDVPELVGIEPGATIDGPPPPGWSHRVVRSTLRLTSGDLESLPDFARRTAVLFRTVILAEVRPAGDGRNPAGYELRRIGVGLAMEDRDAERVVTADSLDRLGVRISLFDKVVLRRAEAAVARGRLAARTPTFALYDASLEMAEPGGPHRSAYLRYALLVEPRTGILRTLVWPVAEAPKDRVPPAGMVLLLPGAEFSCRIQVTATRAPGGLPVAWQFALTNLPPGEVLPLPDALRTWSVHDPADAEESTRMETLLRRALAVNEGPISSSPDRDVPPASTISP